MKHAGPLVLTIALASAACSSNNNSTTTPTPTPPLTSETFSGTVPIGGADGSHTFTEATAGTVNVTLTQVSMVTPPPGLAPNIIVTLGIGTPGASGSCSVLSGASTLAQASTTAQLNGNLNPGTYCISVQDLQGLGPLSYTVTVAHS